MKSRRRLAIVPILIGIIGLMPLMRNSRFAAYHTVDVLQLLASGACFGVGFTLLFASRRPSNGQ